VTVTEPPEVTVTEIDAEPERLPESVTAAVIVWVPTARAEVEKEAPLPMTPLSEEVQTRLEERLPSWVSEAVPLKVTAVPEAELDPCAGAVIVTVGAVLPPLSLTYRKLR
jgi:hypothetical protein